MSEMSDQKRMIIASALSLVVIVVWSLMYRPTPPAPANQPAASGAASGASGVAPAATATAIAAPVSPDAIGDTAEKSYVIENDLYRVEFSNRGAVVRSWQLKSYMDSSDPPQPLELVHADVSQKTNNWPFSLQLTEAQAEQAVNNALYLAAAGEGQEQPAATTLHAPAEIEFRWSDGQTAVIKRLKFDESYIVEVHTSVQKAGQPVSHRVAWRGGFGDVAAFQATQSMNALTGAAGSIKLSKAGDLGMPDQRTTAAEVPGSFDVVGIEDRYFVAAFLPPEPPPGQPVPAIMTLSGRQLVHSTEVDGNTRQEIVPEIAAGTSTAGPMDVRVFVGPKDLDVLQAVRPPLDSLVQFGWFAFIAAPLFYVLRWIHDYVPNYGWAIVLMTIAINTILYPLKLKSWRSMQKMQKVAPEIRSIQDRYKKYSMRDPRKQEMNKEVMAIYSREGINPMGSCLPMLVQMPIWFGLYRMLTVTLELRHAPWVGWINDLSGPDPYYILPVLMAALMYVAQKMTPMTATDPAQQRMMTFMPLMFGGMFVVFPVASGLVLYMLAQNVVGIAQQWHLNRTSPLKATAKRTASAKEGKARA
jgi:YidC/Oxa1 family membrane protein insertase